MRRHIKAPDLHTPSDHYEVLPDSNNDVTMSVPYVSLLHPRYPGGFRIFTFLLLHKSFITVTVSWTVGLLLFSRLSFIYRLTLFPIVKFVFYKPVNSEVRDAGYS